MYYEVKHSEKIKLAKDKIELYNKRRYLNMGAIDFQEDKILVCVEDQNNPYIMDFKLTKVLAVIVANET